ncbi:MAG: type II secretion system minor pseudopilin GspI [Polaromonas sp.]|nr:type II secretion system minor pseudopilin GspI [Polaromonas sp.]
MPARPTRGFTLIEVLVALAIVAIALSAGVQASGALIHNAQRQSDTLLAQLCADNELIKMRLSKQMPGVGDIDFTCEQAGRSFGGTLSVFATPNPSFMRVEAHVRNGTNASAHPLLTVATVVGRF